MMYFEQRSYLWSDVRFIVVEWSRCQTIPYNNTAYELLYAMEIVGLLAVEILSVKLSKMLNIMDGGKLSKSKMPDIIKIVLFMI